MAARTDHEDVKSGIEAVKNHHREAREGSSHKCTVLDEVINLRCAAQETNV